MNVSAIAGPARRPLAHLLAVTTAIVGCYWGLWNAYFSQDDFWMFGAVRHLSLREAAGAHFGYAVRLLLDLSMWARMRLFGLDAAPYYWLSLAQHAVVAGIVYSLTTLWTRHRAVAFLAALLFGTAFAPYEVVTWITGSEYSLAAIPYLASLGLFALYLRRRRPMLYVTSLLAFLAALLVHEVALSLPFVLAAYHLTAGRGLAPPRPFGWRDVRLHLPYAALFAGEFAAQLWFVAQGWSEARVARVDYGPGFHMLGNFFYLIHLIVPNVHDAVLTDWFGAPAVEILRYAAVAAAFALNGLAAFLLWKGSPLVRFAVCVIYLSFLPYTLWHGRFAGAGRYLYLPAVGFSILLALGAVHVHERWRSRRRGRLGVSVAVALLVLFNALVIQTWVRRHVDNGDLRRAVVADLEAEFLHVPPGSTIYMEVPKPKFLDLAFACRLVIRQAVRCEAFVGDQHLVFDGIGDGANGRSYWVRATRDGIVPIQAGDA